MKKAIISGVTGFFGSALARLLLEEGTEVIGIGTNKERMKELEGIPGFRPVYADFSLYPELPALIPDRGADVFYHLAWAGGFTTAIRDYHLQMKNAACAGDALTAAYRMNAGRFVYAGTYNQFEISRFLDTQGFEPRYTCIYSAGKTAGGLICRTLAYNLGIPYVGGLAAMPYGEGNRSMQLVNVVITSLLKGESPRLVEGNNPYDLVYIGDLARAFQALGMKGRNGHEYYIGHRTIPTFRQWMIRIRDILSPDTPLLFGAYEDRQQIDFDRIDLEALYRDTGFSCRADFDETIRRTADWVKLHLMS